MFRCWSIAIQNNICSLALVVLALAICHTRSFQLPSKTPSSEFRGFLRREYSLAKPYDPATQSKKLWMFGGSTIISNDVIRLTPNEASRQGYLWSAIPVNMRDWELDVSFAVHGTTGNLFGDGMAIWYAEEVGKSGPVFGGPDMFRGLAIFLDTYTNHPDAHNHAHPYISAMVNNGSLRYDHDRDGTHTQLGGHGKGCTSEFRNRKHPTRVLVRYVGETLSVYTDIMNFGYWDHCFTVENVNLPMKYHFGFSAATGDLSDIHDLISLKVFQIDYARVEKENFDALKMPYMAAPRDHVEDNPPPSRLATLRTGFFFIVALIVVAVFIVVAVLFIQKQQESRRKRFY